MAKAEKMFTPWRSYIVIVNMSIVNMNIVNMSIIVLYRSTVNMNFSPNKIPIEIIKEDAFGGTYFRDIYSDINTK